MKEKLDPFKRDSSHSSSKVSIKLHLSPTPHSQVSKRSRSRSRSGDTRQNKTKSKEHKYSNKTTDDDVIGLKVVKRQVVSQGSTEVISKDSDTQSEPQSTSSTKTPSETVKDNKEQNYWKDFPFPKFYKDLKKFYDPIPKPGELPPSMYFPYDGPKLRRYKNYRPYKDPLSKYNDEEYYGTQLKELIFQDLQNFKRKLELFQLDVEMATLRSHNVK